MYSYKPQEVATDKDPFDEWPFGDTTKIGENPLIFLLELDARKAPGEDSTHLDFHALIAQVQKEHPGVHFQVVPVYYAQMKNGDQAVSKIYLIAD